MKFPSIAADALRNGWDVEVWAWEAGTSRRWRDFQDAYGSSGKFALRRLDEHLGAITTTAAAQRRRQQQQQQQQQQRGGNGKGRGKGKGKGRGRGGGGRGMGAGRGGAAARPCCRDFRAGRCTRGDQCRFAHE